MNNTNNKGGGFMTGFMWGIIIGAALVFLFATKKGKKLLKVISEEGIEISEILGDLQTELEEDGGNVVSKKKNVRVAPEEEIGEETVDEVIEEVEKPKSNGSSVKKVVSTGKRFFRGIPKRN